MFDGVEFSMQTDLKNVTQQCVCGKMTKRGTHFGICYDKSSFLLFVI